MEKSTKSTEGNDDVITCECRCVTHITAFSHSHSVCTHTLTTLSQRLTLRITQWIKVAVSVPRWVVNEPNSTRTRYRLMTVAAEEFRSKFVFLKISKNHDEQKRSHQGRPHPDIWIQCQLFCLFLKIVDVLQSQTDYRYAIYE